MKIQGINGYVLVQRRQEEGPLGKVVLSEIFAIVHQADGHDFKQGDTVIIDPTEKTLIDGFVLVREENIKGVVEFD